MAVKLDMLRPMAAQNRVDYTLEPKGDATAVTWAMSGATPLLGKVFGLFVDCDKMVGKDFEETGELKPSRKSRQEDRAAFAADASPARSAHEGEPYRPTRRHALALRLEYISDCARVSQTQW